MAHDPSHNDAAHNASHGAEEHEHPGWSTYWKVALLLTVITGIEVYIYYTPFKDSRFFAPTLIAMSAFKFAVVVLFYMHLRYDHRLFKALFTGPLIIGMVTGISLLFLFGHFGLALAH